VLHARGLGDLAEAELRPWQDRAAVFGLHLVCLDLRDNSTRLRAAMDELMRVLGLAPSWEALEEEERQKLLVSPLPPHALPAVARSPLSAATRDLVDLFMMIQKWGADYGSEGLGALIVSMTHRPSDALAMMWLNRLGARLVRPDADGIALPVVPLLETIDDLKQGTDIVRALLSVEPYRAYVREHGNRQVCMVGYSDSAKDGGYLAANWALYQCQQQIAAVAAEYDVDLVVFHGRGGALGRGGGPAARAIRSLPPEAVRGRLRMTEQGEVIADRFDDVTVAHRHLEQVVWATLLVSGEARDPVPPEWEALLAVLSEQARTTYRELVDQESFLLYFRTATPIACIEQLPIASRPSRRHGAGSLEDLRAIPFTFAWTQSRQLINAFYGLGTAVESMGPEALESLQAMYQAWPFFRAVIDNAELALAKCDESISRFYAGLVTPRDAGMPIWERIRQEVETSRRVVLAINGQSELLGGTPWLRRSITVRNPLVDLLNLIQVELLRRHGAHDGSPCDTEMPELDAALRLSVQAIAAGLRNTG
jgi:phosphoenolpyruvate carboxylase